MQACHDTGIKLPFIVCAVCPNGSVVCMRSTGYGEGSDILAEHYEPEGLLLPINIMNAAFS